jgi:hypothetical protein
VEIENRARRASPRARCGRSHPASFAIVTRTADRSGRRPVAASSPGETFEDAARRESIEELGAAPASLRMSSSATVTFPWGNRIIRAGRAVFPRGLLRTRPLPVDGLRMPRKGCSRSAGWTREELDSDRVRHPTWPRACARSRTTDDRRAREVHRQDSRVLRSGARARPVRRPYARDLAGRSTARACSSSPAAPACDTRPARSPAAEATVVATDLKPRNARVRAASCRARTARVPRRRRAGAAVPGRHVHHGRLPVRLMFVPDKDRASGEAIARPRFRRRFVFNTWDTIERNRSSASRTRPRRDLPRGPRMFYRVPFVFRDPGAIRRCSSATASRGRDGREREKEARAPHAYRSRADWSRQPGGLCHPGRGGALGQWSGDRGGAAEGVRRRPLVSTFHGLGWRRDGQR